MARATIEDVAKAAGVSIATVDRVLNARASVRPANAKRVEDAISVLGYRPDRLAARLAKCQDYRLCFVIPEGGRNAFMASLESEVARHAAHLAGERVIANIVYANVFDAASLATILGTLQGYDGVAVVALDHPQVREAINQLVAQGTEVVTLVSDVPGSNRAHFVGVDNSSAGRTAATLMGRYLSGRAGKVGIIAGAMALRDHAERHFGFVQVLGQDYRNLQILPVLEGRDDAGLNERIAAELLAAHPDLVGLYNLGAGTEGIVSALRHAGRSRDTVFIAHELNAQSRKGLIDGAIDVVIAQDAGHEARSAMRVLMARLDKTPIVAAMERISIDIYVRDNLP